MNLHGIVSGAIGSVNPQRTIALRKSIGYSTDAAGKRTPLYSDSTGEAQIQNLNSKELQHMNELNINGVFAKVYLYGEWSSIVRNGEQGGDLLVFDSATWLIVNQVESWPDWCAVIVQQQLDPTGVL